MSDVPPDLINLIFTRLPVQSLLRFRCVSKSFCALIDSPNFIKSHLNQSLISNSHQTLLTFNYENTQINSTEFDSLDKPSVLSRRATKFNGSCNGLLCLCDGVVIFVFNPATREFRRLPHYRFDDSRGHFSFMCDNVVHGFGFDCVDDDYKVLQIIQCTNESKDEFVICSLKSNSWRRIVDFPYYICCNADNVFINGALHWVVTLKRQRDYVISDFNVDARIVCFDLATEEYRFVPQPEIPDRELLMDVGELGGRLCLHCISTGKFMDLWVMDCYGVKESWTKLLSIVQPVDIRKIKYLKAIAYSADGERVLFEQGGGRLFWYDLKPKRKHVKRIRIPGLPIFYQAGMCMESLVKLTDVSRKEISFEERRYLYEVIKRVLQLHGYNTSMQVLHD